MLVALASSSATATTTIIPLFSSPLIQFSKPSKPFNSIQQSNAYNKSFSPPKLTLTKSSSISFNFATQSENSFSTEEDDNNHWEFPIDEIDDDDDVSPWEGAVLYKRNSSVSHLEYCTTLERLGLGKLSSEVSNRKASDMGMRVLKSVTDYPNGTPVLISIDVIRRKQKLRLDGMVRTVIALGCNRCGGPAAQSIYSTFSLLLCEEPIQEPDTISMGVIFGEDKSKEFGTSEGEVDDSFIDLDDQLHFPLDKKVIDISKNIRDLIHIEITINAICDPNCKGLCLNCGTNLNNGACNCEEKKVVEKGYGPLGDLRKQMQETGYQSS